MIGKSLAHYEIIDLLGKGGMGEVYRARDRKLGREVAIKILPADLAGSPERLARFDREARTLATLQHPNVASAYGLEETAEARFLVMELVEGEGLDTRMARGPVPVAEARSIAAQIACGLDAAHEKGIVHRDLKPANIRLSPDGTVKVLDFGLAKAWAGDDRDIDLSSSPTITAMATIEGVILGTAGYMSPEQARGQAVDKRTDIWAFGVILWEMLSGQRLFEGNTVSDVMAGVLRAEISDSSLPADTPPALRRLLRRCLERDLKHRLRDIGDATLELAETSGEDAGVGSAPRRGRRNAWLAALAVAVAGTALATWLIVGGARPDEAAPAVVHFEQKTYGKQVIFNTRFLPENGGIVYSAAAFGNVPQLLYLAQGASVPRRIGPDGTHLLAVSREGELAVLTDARYRNHRVLEGTLARMTIDGGPRPMLENVRDADWGPGGELAVVRRVGGVDRLEYPLGKVLYETSGYIADPRISPDGTQVAFHDHQWWLDDRGWLKLVDGAGQVSTLSDEYWAIEGVVWTPDAERILFAAARGTDVKLTAMEVRLDDRTVRTILGAPDQVTVLDIDAAGRLLILNETAEFGVATRPRGADRDIDLTWQDACWGPILAPDNRTLVFTDGRGGSANYSVVMRTTDGSPLTTLGEGNALNLSPDGTWVSAQIASPPGVSLYPTGTGSARQLEPGPIVQFHDAQWFPDSRELLITGNESSGPVRCYRQSIDGGAPERLEIDGPEDFSLLTLDGTAVLGLTGDSHWNLYPLDGGEPRPMPGLHGNDEIQAWNRDGTAVYVIERRTVPCTFVRVDLATQQRVADVTFGPEREPGLLWITVQSPVFDPAAGYAYAYHKRLTQLFVVTGAGIPAKGIR